MSKQSESQSKGRVDASGRVRYRKSETPYRRQRWTGYHNRKVWFLRGDLVTLHHQNNAQGVVTLYNYTKDRLETMSNAEFKRSRRKAYNMTESAELLNRERGYLTRKAREGWWPEPMGRGVNGARIAITSPCYYSEEHLYEIRELMADIHHGPDRADGLVSNTTTPSESELRAKINEHYFVYLKDENGNYVPTLDTLDHQM